MVITAHHTIYSSLKEILYPGHRDSFRYTNCSRTRYTNPLYQLTTGGPTYQFFFFFLTTPSILSLPSPIRARLLPCSTLRRAPPGHRLTSPRARAPRPPALLSAPCRWSPCAPPGSPSHTLRGGAAQARGASGRSRRARRSGVGVAQGQPAAVQAAQSVRLARFRRAHWRTRGDRASMRFGISLGLDFFWLGRSERGWR